MELHANIRVRTVYDISRSPILKNWNYFETSHYKNVGDRLGAIVKSYLHQAILSGNRIGTAEKVFKHCEEKLDHGTKKVQDGIITRRDFVFVNKSEVDLNTEQLDKIKVKTLKGTRQLHAVKSIGETGKVHIHNLSCFYASYKLGRLWHEQAVQCMCEDENPKH